MKTSASRTVSLSLIGVSFAAFIAVGSAHADQRGAPIIYADASNPVAAASIPPSATSSATAITSDKRIEFQYPTQGAAMAARTPAKLFVPAPTVAAAKPFLAAPTVTSAQNVLAQAPTAPIRIASVQAQQTVRTGKPLTLSRVSANRDAKITEESGKAGIYTDGFNGQPTANGEIFDETAMTAAHPSLPLPSLVQVINEDNSREVVVRVNDRGPFDGKRILELSPRAGSVLGISKGGAASVRVRYLGPAPVQQNPETFASNRIEDESLPPVATPITPPVTTLAPSQVAAYDPAPFGAPAATLSAPAPAYTPPVRVASMTVAAPVATGNFFIQAGAFADIANAQRLTASLGGRQQVKIEEARVNGGDYFRVLIGPFSTMDMAERERSALSRSGVVDGFLTTR